jgi:hypothetical protein
MSRSRRTIVTGLASLALVSIGAAPAVADPASPDNGCHGYYTTQFKELSGDRGAQGAAIGGLGNSDGDPANGQLIPRRVGARRSRPSWPISATSRPPGNKHVDDHSSRSASGCGRGRQSVEAFANLGAPRASGGSVLALASAVLGSLVLFVPAASPAPPAG